MAEGKLYSSRKYWLYKVSFLFLHLFPVLQWVSAQMEDKQRGRRFIACLSQLEMLGNIFLNMRGESFSFGQFEEQQAFEKSRKFLRQLEICFAENPAHHQKIIKVLQSCADCLPQEIAEVIGHPGISLLSKPLGPALATCFTALWDRESLPSAISLCGAR